MTLEELRANIQKFDIPDEWYSIDDGLKPMAHILYKNYSMWEYFYLDERGGRDNHHAFRNSEDAYAYLWERLKVDSDYGIRAPEEGWGKR